MLLLLVIKHGPTDAEVENDGLLEIQIAEITEEIATKKEEKTKLKQIAVEMENQIQRLTSEGSAKSAISNIQAKRLSELLKELRRTRAELEKSQQALAQAAAENEKESTDAASQANRSHLTGLLVNEGQVAILLDTSASMLATSLVEIIRLRASPTRTKLRAEKWSRATAAALWAYDKIPTGARFQLVTFNETASDLLGNPNSTQKNISWLVKDQLPLSTSTLKSKLTQLVPNGPTDLKSALVTAGSLQPRPKQVILITDGLPTLPGTASLSRLSECPRSNPSGRAPLLSPQCRRSILNDAVRAARRALQGTRVDVILLPLEGDSNAIDGYWTFTREFGGRVLSPYSGWPHS